MQVIFEFFSTLNDGSDIHSFCCRQFAFIMSSVEKLLISEPSLSIWEKFNVTRISLQNVILGLLFV